jgi:hypothetical protein
MNAHHIIQAIELTEEAAKLTPIQKERDELMSASLILRKVLQSRGIFLGTKPPKAPTHYPKDHEVSKAVARVCYEMADLFKREGYKFGQNMAESIAAETRHSGWKPSKIKRQKINPVLSESKTDALRHAADSVVRNAPDGKRREQSIRYLYLQGVNAALTVLDFQTLKEL